MINSSRANFIDLREETLAALGSKAENQIVVVSAIFSAYL